SVPRIAYINKMDRDGANFYEVLDQIKERLGASAVALQLPIGQESDFHGVIDLLNMKGIYYQDDDTHGSTYDTVEIPDDLKAKAEEFHAEMIEKVAETDDVLMEKFLNEEEISVEELKAAIRKATIANVLVPVICGSSY